MSYVSLVAYLSAALSVASVLARSVLFLRGGVFVTISDIISLAFALSFVLLVLALAGAQKSPASSLRVAALLSGIIGGAAGAIFQLVLLFHFFTLARQSAWMLLVGIVASGVWLIITGLLDAREGDAPRGLEWLAGSAGAGYLFIALGILSRGQLRVLTFAGIFATAVAYPLWAVWVGRLLSQPPKALP